LIFAAVTALPARSDVPTQPLQITSFAIVLAIASGSGDAKKEPAAKAPTAIIIAYFTLIMRDGWLRLHKGMYGRSNAIVFLKVTVLNSVVLSVLAVRQNCDYAVLTRLLLSRSQSPVSPVK